MATAGAAVDAANQGGFALTMGGYGGFAETIAASMTRDQATAVRELRVDGQQTWRGVAGSFCERFPDAAFTLGLTEDQGLGVALCSAAAWLLGEDPNAEPWN